MIDSIKIKNFETHLDTNIKLHPGTNIIVGESDEGKSSIIRAIKWNAQNRPQGTSYRNDQLNPKLKSDKLQDTFVAIDYHGTGLVRRSRNGVSGGVNNYTIETEEPLRALRTDVPNEVQNVTKMKEVNIQGQHPTEQYFLLADKPGQVAKAFNKVAGLTVMDKATADINSQVRDCNSEIKVAEKEIENREKELKESKWLLKAENFANKLQIYSDEVKTKQNEYNILLGKINHLNEIDETLTKYYYGLDKGLKKLSELKKEKQAITDKTYTQKQINDLLFDMKSIDTKLKNSNDTTNALKALKELKTLKKDILNKQEQQKKIDDILFIFKQTEYDLLKAERDYIETKKEYEIMKEKTICPTCGRTGK